MVPQTEPISIAPIPWNWSGDKKFFNESLCLYLFLATSVWPRPSTSSKNELSIT